MPPSRRPGFVDRDPEAHPLPRTDVTIHPSERIAPGVRAYLAGEIAAAGGREVSFVAQVDRDGVVTAARAVARGTVDMVLALPGVAQRGEMLLHNHPSGRLEPSGADLDVAARLHDGGVGFGIIDNGATELYVVVEVPRDQRGAADRPVRRRGRRWASGGRSRAELGHTRTGGASATWPPTSPTAYNDGGVQLLEAGTGRRQVVRLPGAGACLGARERRAHGGVHQHDQPAGAARRQGPAAASPGARRPRSYTPTFALLKGWRNYLCLARLHQAVGSQRTLLEQDKLDELLGIAEWAGHTADGTLSDLPVTPSPEVWDEVSAEPDLCTRLKCAHFDRCFLFRARRRAAEADVVVVNHHLLAADLAVRQAQDNWDEAAVLPPYDRLVLDEGHHLEDVAAAHLGVQVSSRAVRRLLSRFERNGRGLAPTLPTSSRAQGDLLSRASLDLLRERLLPALADARRASDAMFLRLCDRLDGRPAGQLRLATTSRRTTIWDEGLAFELDATLAAFRALREIGGDDRRPAGGSGGDRAAWPRCCRSSAAVMRRLDGDLRRPQPDAASGRRRPADRAVDGAHAARASSSASRPCRSTSRPSCATLLFDRLDTVVLTSATLAAGGDFDFLETRLGLGGR